MFFPIRLLAIGYTDLFRGIPTILLVLLFGFGIPTLQLSHVTRDPVYLGAAALVVIYTAYVSEVYRAGIESVHPSQEAAARSLGLTRGQTMQTVILPQAVRRVIPPLLNDFIGLQKDTALISVLGPVEALQRANAGVGQRVQLHALRGGGVLLRADHGAAGAADRLADRRDRKRQMAGGRV